MRIRRSPALPGLPILSWRNSPGKIVYPSSQVSARFLKILQIFQRPSLSTENSETWCGSFLCAADQEKNIKKIFEKNKNRKKKTTIGAKIGKKRKTVAHSQEHQSAVLLCDFLCSSLVPCCPLILFTFLVPSYNCANTIFRPATRTSTLDIYLVLLSVSDLCATYTYIFCAIPSSTFS